MFLIIVLLLLSLHCATSFPKLLYRINDAICNNVDWSRNYCINWIKSERKTNTIWYHIYVELKILCKWISLQNRNIITDRENRFMVAKVGEEWGKDGLGVWD